MVVKHVYMTWATAACAAAAVLWGASVPGAGQDGPPAVFTAPQAAEGRKLYRAHCASCHMPDLSGNNDAPPLAGKNFVGTWGLRSVKDLFDYIAATMPPDGAALPAETFGSIVAHILSANGAAAGPRPFDGSASAPLKSLVGVDLGVVSSESRVEGNGGFILVPPRGSLDRIVASRR